MSEVEDWPIALRLIEKAGVILRQDQLYKHSQSEVRKLESPGMQCLVSRITMSPLLVMEMCDPGFDIVIVGGDRQGGLQFKQLEKLSQPHESVGNGLY